MTKESITLVNENGRIVGKNTETGEIVPLEMGEIHSEKIEAEQISPSDSPQRIHVRVDGDDSAQGTANDPIESIDEALNRLNSVPIAPFGGVSHEIILDSKSRTIYDIDDTIRIDLPSRAWVRIRSQSSSENARINPQTNGSEAIQVSNRSKLTLENIEIRADSSPPNRTVRAVQGSYIDLRGSSVVTSGTNRQLDVRQGSRAIIHSDAIIRGIGKNRSAMGVTPHSGSFLTMSGTIENCRFGVMGTRGAFVSATGTIDSCERGMMAADGSAMKIRAGGGITNCEIGLRVGNDAILKYDNSISFSGTDRNFQWAHPNGVIVNSDDWRSDIAVGPEGINWRTLSGEKAFSVSEKRVNIFEQPFQLEPQDVRTIEAAEGDIAYHNGSGSNTEGPAFYNGSVWTSMVDGAEIE